MNQKSRDFLAAVIIVALINVVFLLPQASAALKVWNNSEIIQIADLNSNFAQLSAQSITDSQVATNAGIQHVKLQTPALLPKAWAVVTASCTSTPCTQAEGAKIGTITRTGTGAYTVALAYSPVDSTRGTLVTPSLASATNHIQCQVTNRDSNNEYIECFRESDNAAADTGFMVVVFDQQG